MKTFGKYDILEEIGKGGFATVFRAHDTALDRDAALKVLNPLLMRDPEWVRRFRQEAKNIAHLEHPHIVTIYDVGENEGRLFIAMQLASNGDLASRIRQQGALSWQKTLNITEQVAQALDFAHQHGITHRDLKPHNILFDKTAGVLLTDFGFTRIVADNAYSVTLSVASGDIVGTPAYIAPEIWDGQHASLQSDVYSLGCIVYEMVMGHPLFTGETPWQIMKAHSNGPQFPNRWPDGVPADLQEVLAKALAADPTARYANAREFALALAALSTSSQAPGNAGHGDVISPASSSSKSSKWPLLVSIAMLLIIFMAGGWWTVRRQNRLEITTFASTPIAQDRAPVIIISSSPTAKFTPTPAASPITTFVPTPTNKPTPTPTLGIGSTMISKTDGMEMVYVPAGEFLMGNPLGMGDKDEYPQHKVYLNAFWIDKTEVTKGMFLEFLRTTDPDAQVDKSNLDYPAVVVNWNEANAYCNWAGKRLPTEAEWEKAASGLNHNNYPWGNQFSGTKLNYCDINCTYSWADAEYDDGFEESAPVGSYPEGKSDYGALDMAGNVFEWVSDWYNEHYYDNSPSRNPQGPDNGTMKVVRGGSWYDNRDYQRTMSRSYFNPIGVGYNIGFRCAMPVSPNF